MVSETFTIVVGDEGSCKNRHYRISKGSVLQLKLGPSLEFRNIIVKTNMPITGEAQNFKRDTFYTVPLSDGYIVPIRLAGAFDFKIEEAKTGESLMEGCFVVDPELAVGSGESLRPEEISCQTYLVKSLGPLSDWKSRLSLAKDCGFNMVHLTPVQQLGVSNSSYSIKDHFHLNSTLNCDDESQLSRLVDEIRREWGVLTISDVVLNHTSVCSEWVVDHPESCYNLEECPHLRPAYLVDRAVANFNSQVARGEWESHGLGPEIRTDEHLFILGDILRTWVILPLKIHEMFCCDVAAVLEDFRENNLSFFADFALVQDSLYRRNKSRVKSTNLLTSSKPLSTALEELNKRKKEEVNEHLEQAILNVVANARYNFVDPRGHRWEKVTEETPIMRAYFSLLGEDVPEEELWGEKAKHVVALNGWVMGWDSLRDFADADSLVYLRRELIVWGDSIKLRYGKSPLDSPYLWQRMERYVSAVAAVFQGVRLDNLHSTPLHVAQHMVDEMRKVNPNLYVLAELFTGSEETDSIFSNTLGITTLVREAFSAWDPHELGRLVYKFGGRPIGSFTCPFERTLSPGLPQAMLMDLTHDNPCPLQERSLLYPTAATALISVAACAIGSTRGYDEFVPHQIDVVNEKRLYSTEHSHFHPFRREMNRLHLFLSREGYDEIFVDQMTPNIVAITRRSSRSLDTIISISHNSFTSHPSPDLPCRPLCLEGDLTEIILESYSSVSPDPQFQRDSQFINGLTNVSLSLETNIHPDASKMLNIIKNGNQNTINLTSCFTPGSVVVFRVDLPPRLFRDVLSVDIFCHSLRNQISSLNLLDLNRILYRHPSEEQPGEEYHIPQHGTTVYNGLQGQMSLIDKITRFNDQNHPLCRNLRDGNWIMAHSALRLTKLGFTEIGHWLFSLVESIGNLPRSSVPPRYFYVVSGLYHLLVEQCYRLLLSSNDRFLMRMLKLGSVILFGEVGSASLPPLAVPLSNKATMAAGLPHFSHGIFRNWGRDTFISLRGLLLLTGRLDEARALILGFAGTLRHGLIPNLLGDGLCSRYNARDAVWFWLQAIKDFVAQAGNTQILGDHVLRTFPQRVQPLREVMQEALSEHFRGISFREDRAGSQIDEHMSSEGFNVTAGVDLTTGFVFGGSRFNCGTWMDKMGSCQFSGNRGTPASPRDGSAVELVALCYSVVSWLSSLHSRGEYPYDGVESAGTHYSWNLWALKISENFERSFYISTLDSSPYAFRRGIYKDTLGSSAVWADYQLRPNFCLAMIYAPELFDDVHAWEALGVVENLLLGPLGLKTLDPEDWNYNGVYKDDVVPDPKTSKGFNYHQGPEWLWVCGAFLRAKMMTARRMESRNVGTAEETRMEINKYILNHYNALVASDWRGLEELTNENGKFCEGSCLVQAWSMATFIELVDILD